MNLVIHVRVMSNVDMSVVPQNYMNENTPFLENLGCFSGFKHHKKWLL